MDRVTANEAFGRALEDARFDEDVIFVPFINQPDNAPAAALHAAGENSSPEELQPLDAEARKMMLAKRDSYRITCWLGLPDPVVRAVLRHELEHAKQWRWGGGKLMFQLALAERDVMDEVSYARLPANGQVYNLVPIELDANGAASRYARQVEGPDRADEYAASIDPGLFRLRPPPEPYETLALRVICHGAVWPEALEKFFGFYGPPLGGLLDQLVTDGRVLWQRLAADDMLIHLRQRVADAVPKVEDINNSESLEAGWRPTKTAILAAVDRARALTGLAPTPAC
jgi:hypothetical protein